MVDVVFDCNLCELEATDKSDAIKELTLKSKSLKMLSNPKKFQENVIKREKSTSTGLGKGVAIAHGDCSENEKLIVALGISHKGIEFNSIDQKPVHILFLVANPPNSQKEYLHILSTIVGLLRHETFRRSIITTHDPILMNTRLRNSLNLSN
ncbi:MAG: PTS sugar transporter subunit IIA [Spirochaetia bacterium]|nr:PTS sugar transporter subunit IIA [Spirochaetia bacterium]